jgi:very-short-patch-repair endonuclease
MDGVREYIFPWQSEKDFIKRMGRFWLWRRGFKHQVVVGPYRADFASSKLHQIIEVDGASKVPKFDVVKIQEYREAQAVRERYLMNHGWSILHIPVYAIQNHPRVMKREVSKWVSNPHYEPTIL